MHLTLKQETTRPAGGNILQQQARFDAFIHEFNGERPYQALNMQCPGELYTPAPRAYRGLPELAYPFHVLYFTLFRQNSSDYSDARPRNFLD